MSEPEWIIDQLVQQGIRHFCISPGSRSTPLVLATAEHPQAKIHIHYDERGSGFFALGIGKATQAPAAIIVTSGTAVGNLLPSVMEAHHTNTPLLLLTADRPPELRDCGANQTTDQVKIFQPFIRWQADLPTNQNENYFRSVVAQACFYACQNPPGPVQINCPFREPFSIQESRKPIQGPSKPIRIEFPRLVPKPLVSAFSKGIIVIGKLPSTEDLLSILELSKRLQWPIFADLLSNGRNVLTPEQIIHFDWILKTHPPLQPDQILHFGERLTSKKLLEWIKEKQADLVHISPYPTLQDPNRILNSRIQASIPEFCASFQASTDPQWLAAWQELDREIAFKIESFFKVDASFTEAHAMRALSQSLPPDCAVFLGNGMPIRDADHFLFPPKTKGYFGNRGLSGIDGNIATAAGLSEGLQSPLLAFIGDQATLHDLNSLPLLKKSSHPVYLVVSNNFGGGIFSHLSISKSPHFEELFAAAHKWHFQDAAKMFEIPYLRLENPSEKELKEILLSSHSFLIEWITDRQVNCLFQKKLTHYLTSNLKVLQ